MGGRGKDAQTFKRFNRFKRFKRSIGSDVSNLHLHTVPGETLKRFKRSNVSNVCAFVHLHTVPGETFKRFKR